MAVKAEIQFGWQEVGHVPVSQLLSPLDSVIRLCVVGRGSKAVIRKGGKLGGGMSIPLDGEERVEKRSSFGFLSDDGEELDLAGLLLNEEDFEEYVREALAMEGRDRVTSLLVNMNDAKVIPEGLLPSRLLRLDVSDNCVADLAKGLPHELEELLISNNGTGDTLVKSLVTNVFESLRVLDLSGNEISNLPSEISTSCPQLRSLSINRNRLQNLPDSLEALPLEELFISGNDLGPRLPRVVFQLRSLRSLGAASNNIQDIPEELCHLSQLRTLALMWNNIETLPPVVLKLKHLHRLDMNNNKLRKLPSGLDELTELMELYVAGNKLTALPTCLKNLKVLRELDISSNPKLDVNHVLDSIAGLHVEHLAYDGKLDGNENEEVEDENETNSPEDEKPLHHNQIVTLNQFHRGRRQRHLQGACWPIS